MISKFERIINTQNVTAFFNADEVNDWYLEYVHRYSLGAANRKAAEIRLSDPQGAVDVFSEITYKQEAFMFLVITNNHAGWQTRLESAKNDKCHKLSAGKWTQVNKSVGNKSFRVANKSGWSDDGIEFYRLCMTFFRGLREHSDFTNYRGRAKGWYLLNVVQAKNERTRKNYAKRLRTTEEVAGDPEAFADWDNEGLWDIAT